MTRRRILAAAASVALLAVAALVGFVALLRSAVTQANVDRVRGLELTEVEQLLGGPGEPLHGNIGKAVVADLAIVASVERRDVATAVRWDDGPHLATVLFDADGVALGGVYVDRRPPGLLTRLRRLLGL